MIDTIRRLWRTRRLSVIAGGVVVLIAIVAALAIVLSGGSDKPAAKRARATTTTKPPKVCHAPLTGLVVRCGTLNKRPAITVKINNTDEGVQYGLEGADVLYEEVVEGGYTRIAAIFNSHAPHKVGPVRSVRKTDQSIVWPIGGIFAYSGGAQYAIDSISTAPVTQLDETRAGDMMYRDDSLRAPFNLFAHVDKMYDVKDAKPVPPPRLFSYRAPKAPVGGEPVGSFVVGFEAGFAPTWTWDAERGLWLRTPGEKGASAADAHGNPLQLSAKNVVVMFVNYVGGNSYGLGAEAELTGTGPAWVFTGGKVIKGTWHRPDKAKPATFANALGQAIKLLPGQTWVELPDASYAVTITPR